MLVGIPLIEFKLLFILVKFAPIIFGTKYVTAPPDITASTINLEVADDSVVNERDISVVFCNDPDVLYKRSLARVFDPDTDALINKYVCGIIICDIGSYVNVPVIYPPNGTFCFITGNVLRLSILTVESSNKYLTKLIDAAEVPSIL